MNATISDVGVIRSDWKPWPDVAVRTWLIPPAVGSGFHVRVHLIKSGRHLKTADASWANYNRQSAAGFRRAVPLVNHLDAAEQPTCCKLESDGQALLVSETGATGIIDLSAGARRKGEVVDLDANSNLVFARAAVPMLVRDLAAGEQCWMVSAVFGVPATAEEHGWYGKWVSVPSAPDFVPVD